MQPPYSKPKIEIINNVTKIQNLIFKKNWVNAHYSAIKYGNVKIKLKMNSYIF